MSKKSPLCKSAADRLVKEKPIALRLTKRELTKNSRMAGKLDCSDAELARRAYRAGLPLVLNEPASPPAGAPSGAVKFAAPVSSAR